MRIWWIGTVLLALPGIALPSQDRAQTPSASQTIPPTATTSVTTTPQLSGIQQQVRPQTTSPTVKTSVTATSQPVAVHQPATPRNVTAMPIAAMPLTLACNCLTAAQKQQIEAQLQMFQHLLQQRKNDEAINRRLVLLQLKRHQDELSARAAINSMVPVKPQN